jgi:pimeloyl-ACP methyl ester carboxylesterase
MAGESDQDPLLHHKVTIDGLERSALVAEPDGPARGTVLLIHGFPDHHETFRLQLEAVAAAGYRGIAPMLRGYEPSSLPGREEHHFHILRSARDIVEQIGSCAPGPVHLVGHDWGGVAAWIVAGMAPERLTSVTAMAIPPMPEMRSALPRVPGQLLKSAYILFFQLRGVADRVVAANDMAFIDGLWRRWSPGHVADPAFMRRLKDRLGAPGVLHGALGTYRALGNPSGTCRKLSGEMQELLEKPTPIPVLAIGGAEDGCMDTRFYDHANPARYRGGLRVERIEGGGHFIHLERTDAVNAHLLAFFAATAPG